MYLQVAHLYDEEVEAGSSPEKLWAVFHEYVVEAKRLQVLYKDQIKICVGMETEHITAGSLEDVKRLVVSGREAL